MKHSSSLFATLLVFTLLTAPCAIAQTENEASGNRIEKLERDIMLLQRQVSRSGAPSASPSSENGDTAPPMGSAQAEVRISGLEEQIRQLRGKLEESEFQNRKLSENMEKLQRDTEFRFNEITHSTTTATPAADDKKGKKPDEKTPTPKTEKTDIKPDASGKTTAGDGVIHPPESEASENETDFSSPRDHYNYAFRLLNQTQYDKAAESFEAFTKKYPKDPLVGNAYYWMGETFYIRRDYVSAADNFRQGFEELPTGPKAPDNLLKLAMSLNALNRDKEACVVLGQVVTKFKKTSTAITQKAEQEQKRIDCH